MASETSSHYIGTELTVFAAATHWADYIACQIRPYLHGTVFEVGAGQGTRTRNLCGQAARWVAIEPDEMLGRQLSDEVASGTFGDNVTAVSGTLADLPSGEAADTILYLDVLEHIEFDQDELAIAAEKLRAGGHLIVLSPAHQWLYSAFDASIGHYRRYTLRTLQDVGPAPLRVVRRRMLDCVGVLASAANKLLLKSAMPTLSQVRFWDRMMVPVSRWIDPVLGYGVGKSVLVVWQKAA